MNIMECQNSCRKIICALLLSLAMMALPVGGALAGPAGGGHQAMNQEGPQLNSTPVAKVSIDKKMLEAVIAATGERFKVSKETIITDLKGQQVSIRKMLVPCDAEISYEIENGKRVAQRVKIIRYGRNPSWKWIADRPE